MFKSFWSSKNMDPNKSSWWKYFLTASLLGICPENSLSIFMCCWPSLASYKHKGPVSFSYNSSFSACFFSQNSVFLSQQISRNSVSVCFFIEANGVKVFVGPFSGKFPKAQIWVVPRQWRMTPCPALPKSSRRCLALRKLVFCLQMSALIRALLHTFLFGSLNVTFLSGIGPYVEVALYHEPSRHYWWPMLSSMFLNSHRSVSAKNRYWHLWRMDWQLIYWAKGRRFPINLLLTKG